VLSAICSSENVAHGIIANQNDLLEMTTADGVAVFANGAITTAGKTPEVGDIQQLVNALCDQYSGVVYKDDSDGLIYTSNFGQYIKRYASSLNGIAEKIIATSSGIMIIPINSSRTNYALFFRGEQPTECVWGGNPDRSTLFPDKYNPTTLTPRSAFNAWKQLVRGTSIPWIPYEVEAVKSLRDKLVQLN
jgi:chemotaxis family two-component system sensor kinase Cph1